MIGASRKHPTCAAPSNPGTRFPDYASRHPGYGSTDRIANRQARRVCNRSSIGGKLGQNARLAPAGANRPGRTVMPCLTRRTLIQATAGIAAAALAPRVVLAQTTPPPAGPFRQDPLPYAANALEPSIDARTMEIHYGKHHAAYVANLNAVAKDNPQIAQIPVEQVLAKIG